MAIPQGDVGDLLSLAKGPLPSPNPGVPSELMQLAGAQRVPAMQQLRQGGQALMNPSMGIPAPQQQALNTLGIGSTPQIAQSVVQGSLHPLTMPKNLAQGIGNAITWLAAPEVSGVLKGGAALAKLAGATNLADKVTVASQALNPAYSSGFINNIGRTTANAAATGGMYGALTGNPLQQAALGGAIGSAGGIVGGIMRQAAHSAINTLKNNDTMEKYINNLSGNVPFDSVKTKAMNALSQVGQAAQTISNNTYANIFKTADQNGIGIVHPNNIQATAQTIIPSMKNMAEDNLKGVVRDVQDASNPSSLTGLTQVNPASGIRTPISLSYMNSLKSQYFQKAQDWANSNAPNAQTVSRIYNQLGAAAQKDILDSVAGTPLQGALSTAHQFYISHVLPTRPLVDMATPKNGNAISPIQFTAHVLNPENSTLFSAIRPSAVTNPNGSLSNAAQEFNQGLKQFQAVNGTNPADLTKAALITAGEAGKMINGEQTWKNYKSLNMDANAQHLFQTTGSTQSPNTPLFTKGDVQTLETLGNKLGIGNKKVNPADYAFEAAVAGGSNFPAAWAVKKAASIANAHLPTPNKYLRAQLIVDAAQMGQVPAAQEALQDMMSKSHMFLPAQMTKALTPYMSTITPQAQSVQF